MIKPKITKTKGLRLWLCCDGVYWALGSSPSESYDNFKRLSLHHKSNKTGLEITTIPRST